MSVLNQHKLAVSKKFRIPMRGYEPEMVALKLGEEQVPNPHEGL